MSRTFIDLSVRKYGITLALGYCRNVRVATRRPDIHYLVRKVSSNLASTFTVDMLRTHPIIKAYRDIMWELGMNPTKVFPLNELLIRRILRKGVLTPVNSVVDSCNIACIKTLIPLSVFDAQLINYPLIFRRAVAGEEFRYASTKMKVLSGKEVVLADSTGNILHLYPCKDSTIAQVSEGTSEILVVGYGAPGVPNTLLTKAIKLAQALIKKFHPEVKCADLPPP